jgi:phosphoheptose isomerase
MKERTKQIFEELFVGYPALLSVKNEIFSAYETILKCYENKKKTLICGNGGSASDSEHIVGEFMKGFMLKRPVPPGSLPPDLQVPLRSISLVSQTSLITAIANDIGANYIFAQQVLGYADEGDVLLALSTSGNAENVLQAALAARVLKCRVIALTGAGGGKLAEFGVCDCIIKIPAKETYKIQEYTLPLYHALCAMIESELFET